MKHNNSVNGQRNGRLLALFSCLVFALTFLFTLQTLMQGQSSTFAQKPGAEKIGAEVLEAIQVKGEARVVIALIEPPSSGKRPFDLAIVKNEVAEIQNSVLSAVDSSAFEVTHQFEAVPALAGKAITEESLYQLAANPNVRKIDLDAGGTGSLATSVPLIGANTWQNAGIHGNGVVVAVLDSGLDTDHPDLAPGLIHQECFLDADGTINGVGLCPNGSDRQSGPGSAEDDAGHGTHVTGIIGSRGVVSAQGVAPGVSFVAIKVTAGPSFSGVFYSFTEIVAALDFIINSRPDVQVINMSLVTNAQFAGDCDNSTSWNMAGAAAINTLRTRGVIAFASAGNTGVANMMSSPACLSNVMAVGATNNSDQVASFTNSGPTTDLMAPGVGIVSSGIGNTTVSASGTSMASPHAAGCAALLIAGQEAVTPDQLETRLENSPVQVVDPKNGLNYPRLDCSLKPILGVNISGPMNGFVGHEYSFLAAASPFTTTLPVSYQWEATDQSVVTYTSGLSSTVSFIWSLHGTKTITVTAQNAGGVVTYTYPIVIDPSLYLPLILK